jgi:predicted flap endonuclease-1-like 5' DNA nuclease
LLATIVWKGSEVAIAINQLRGMTPILEGDLQARGIYNTEQLLEAARTPGGRTALGEQVGVDTQRILELANRADLSRIEGVAGAYSDLLEQAGVDTVRELAGRNPGNLHAKLVAVNAERRLVRRLPSRNAVANWITQAKDLPRRLEY